MRTVLFSSEDCYKGLDINEDSWVIDSYPNLKSERNIDSTSIRYSQDSWEDVKDYFVEFLNNEINFKEKNTREMVVGVLVAGSVRLWNGSKTGGRAVDIGKLKKTLSMDVDEIEVEVNDNGYIQILGHHHDGTHRMNLYLVTDEDLKSMKEYEEYERVGYEVLDDIKVIEKVVEELEPIKLRVGNGYYN